jgi:(4S)-4-hydroxy-5-phosphonooxypentane-2,3-dione isomerase
MFIVTVDFEIHPEQFDTFMAGMLANAKASVELEENCLQFDVCTDNSQKTHVFLYEVYREAKDFDAHLTMPHFLDFNAKSASQVMRKTVRTLTRIES